MKDIIEQVHEWQFLNQMPSEVAGFALKINLQERDTQYWIFTYENLEKYRSFSILYDKATKEFLARVIVGLTEYCDVDFIVPTIQALEQVLRERMNETINQISHFDKNILGCIFIDKNIIEWPYAVNLPDELAGFTLFIKPAQPLKVLNGSYIIIDYTDFVAESNFIIYYNIYRDEFFGESRIRRIPQMEAIFDAKTLEELTGKLISNLNPILETMRRQLSSV